METNTVKEIERLRTALRELGDRGPCPHPEGNVCHHGIQWDLDCCWRCMKAKIAKAMLALATAQPVTKDLTVGDVLADPTTRTWLKDALRAALRRDPVDAVNDAEVLLEVLKVRCDAILQDKGEGGQGSPLPPDRCECGAPRRADGSFTCSRR